MTAISDLTTEDLQANFELLGDWEERFGYVIDLGRKLPEMDPADMNEATRVHGCQSQVWMKAELSDERPPRMRFVARSDAHIVNGLIAILMTLYNGKTPRGVLETDAEGFLKTLDLEEHLSPTRRNGLHAMLKRIAALAAEAGASAGGTNKEATTP